MRPGFALGFARRDLRGGLRGMAVFLICLMLGVAAIAVVGIVRLSIDRALEGQGAALLGGQAEMSFTYRYAAEDERVFMHEIADKVSEVVTFRSMAVVGQGEEAARALTEVKAVDGAYPLLGQVLLDPQIDVAAALAPRAGISGAILDPVLADRLWVEDRRSVPIGQG